MDTFNKFKPAIETAVVVGVGATAGAYLGTMVGAMVPVPVPGWVWAGVGAGVLGGASRSIQQALMTGSYTFSVNANTGIAVGALTAFMAYSNLDIPLLGNSALAHGLVAGAAGGWFV